MKMMKAVLLDKITETNDVVLSEYAVPEVRPGWVLVKVKTRSEEHTSELQSQY